MDKRLCIVAVVSIICFTAVMIFAILADGGAFK